MLELEPYKIPGRWYKFFIESDGTNNTLTTSDIDNASVSSGTNLVFPNKFHPVDYKLDLHMEGGTATSLKTVSIIIQRYGNGNPSVKIADASLCDYQTAYVYGYFDE